MTDIINVKIERIRCCTAQMVKFHPNINRSDVLTVETGKHSCSLLTELGSCEKMTGNK